MLNMCKILESLNGAKKLYLETEKIPEDVFNVLVDKDVSKTKKYLEWMCRQYIALGERPEHIGDVIKAYDTLVRRHKIDSKDINTFQSLEELEQVVEEGNKKKSKTEITRNVKKDAEVVRDDDKLFIVVPKSHEASKLYGKNTKWCTTSKDSTYWDQYTGQGVKFYYIVNKQDNKKYAVAVYLNGKKEVYDEEDLRISFSALEKVLGM